MGCTRARPLCVKMKRPMSLCVRRKGFTAVPVVVLDSAGQSIRVKGALSAGQEIASLFCHRAEVRLARQGREQLRCWPALFNSRWHSASLC
jgi:hypothetical protein